MFSVARRAALARLIRRPIRTRCIAILLAAAAGASTAGAGQLDDQMFGRTDNSENVDKIVPAASADGKFFVVPVPVVDPTIGYGLAPAALYTFSADPANPGTPRSTIAAVTGYTSTGSWFAGAGFRLYLDGDRYRVGAKGGYGKFNIKFYGFGGGDVLRENPADLELGGPVAETTAQARVAAGIYLGLKLRWAEPTATLGTPVEFFPTISQRTELFGLGPTIEYDTRDSTWYPGRGEYGTLDLLRYDKLGFADSRFWQVDGAFAGYRTLAERLILAGQLRGAYAGEGAPFFMLPYVQLRGLPAGLFLAPSVVQAQTELRWQLAERIGLVGFGGAGSAFGSYLGEDGASFAAAGGAGVRYQISQADKMNIGFDVAVGTDANVSVYFRIGEAF